jgi:peptidyl-prolyl cis-trans isomerase C
MLAAAGLVCAQTPPPAASPKPSTSAPAPGAASAPKPATQTPSGITAPPDPNKVIVTVGSDKLTVAQYEEMVKSLPPNMQQAAKGPQKRQFIDYYVRVRVLSDEAKREGVDKKPEIEAELTFQRNNTLAQALFQDLSANVKVSDADVQKYYDEHKGEFETATAQHILIAVKGSPALQSKPGKTGLTDEEALAKAKEVQKRLLAGEDFAKVSKEMSDDQQPLPPFTHGQMVKEFDEAAFSLPIGKISDPVKTVFGYHVIKVDKRESKTLEQAKAQIEAKLRPQMAQKAMEDLVAKQTVVIDDAFFGPPAPPRVPPAAAASK